MAKTAKYQKARLRETDDSGATFWREVLPSDEFEKPARGDLLCIGCPAEIRRVGSYSRGTGTEVPAYLSLYPKTEHAPDCKLNINTLKAKLSRSDPDGISIEGKVMFLHLPDEERVKNRQPTARKVGAKGKNRSWAETMRSAHTIVRFLEQFEDSTPLLNELKIRYRDHHGNMVEMFWSDFCFEARSPQAQRYYYRIKKHGASAPPAAVIFPVKEPDERPTTRFMRVSTFQKVEDDARSLYFSIAEPRDPDQGRLKGISSKSVLVLGKGRSFEWNEHDVTEVRITIRSAWQIAEC